MPELVDINEDTVVNIHGVVVEDIDEQIAEDYALSVTIQVEHGSMTLATRDGLSFSSGNGKRDEYMMFTAPLKAANLALATITYQHILIIMGRRHSR